jgi:hypothetical protein
MKKTVFIILALIASFSFGFVVKSIFTEQMNEEKRLKRVTGIGGIFFKCKDPKQVRDWYQKHLGLSTNQY